VDALVEEHQLVLVGAGEMVDLAKERLRGRARVGVQPQRRELGRVALELRAHLGDVLDVGGLHCRDERAAPRLHLDEPLERKPLHGLAQRRPPDAHLAHELVLAQHRSRRELERHDAVAHLHVGVLRDQAGGRRVRDFGSRFDGHRVRATILRHW
jgi:hypothetical protein